MRLNTRGVPSRSASALLLPFIVATAAAAQEPVVTLSLDEAIQLARQNNPDFLSQVNDAGVADWAVREAYGALLPGASASMGLSWQDAGNQRFGIFTGDDLGIATTAGYYSSSYSLGLSYRLSGAALLGPSRARSLRDATRAGIDAAALALVADITMRYIAVARAQDGVELAEQELQRARQNQTLAEARVSVGAAVPVELTQAEVETGRAEVGLLQARNLLDTERLRLMQAVGVASVDGLRLTTEFEVFDLGWDGPSLIAMALERHPQLAAARASEIAAETGVRVARTAYLPSLSLSAGLSGFTREATNEAFLLRQAADQAAGQAENCVFLNTLSAGLSTPLPGRPVDCSQFVLSAEQRSTILDRNKVFPFSFSREPWSVSASVSLPIFLGLTRERQVEEARAAASDARLRARAEQLRIRTEVETAFLNTVTAERSVELEERNRQLAQEQMAIARERYRLGAASFMELLEAETLLARAERAYLSAVYAFHENIAALEAAVGRPLREPGDE